MIYNAERRITICSPYFGARRDPTALTNAAYSGIETTVIVCEKGDQFLPNMAQRSYYEQLLRAGVRMQYPSPTVLHSKFVMVDDEIAFIGSSNMDPRSFSLNMEVSTFIIDRGMVAMLDEVCAEYETGLHRAAVHPGRSARAVSDDGEPLPTVVIAPLNYFYPFAGV